MMTSDDLAAAVGRETVNELVTIHCRRLPLRCRSKLPMLLSEGRERHHTCSSVNWSRQCLRISRVTRKRSST